VGSDANPQNPYASPNVPAEGVVLSRPESLRQVWWPALGLSISAGANLAWMVISAATILFLMARSDHPPTRLDEWGSLIGLSLFFVVIVCLQAVILIGCIGLMRGRYGRWTWAASLAGLIPLGGQLCVCVSFLCSVWLLVLLCRKNLRTALGTPSVPSTAVPPSL
jgi:hypothetical protein